MKRINIFTVILIIIILGFFCSYFLIKYFSQKMNPTIINYAEIEIKKITLLIINKSVDEEVENKINADDLFTISKGNNGEIELISYNSLNVTKILNALTSLVQANLKKVEEGKVSTLDLPEIYDKEKLNQGIIYELPMGTITNSFLLASLGPKIPIRFSLIGTVSSKLDTKITEYGINNALLETIVTVTVSTKVISPFVSKDVVITSVTPIAIKVIQGKIPSYYINGITGSYTQEKTVN